MPEGNNTHISDSSSSESFELRCSSCRPHVLRLVSALHSWQLALDVNNGTTRFRDREKELADIRKGGKEFTGAQRSKKTPTFHCLHKLLSGLSASYRPVSTFFSCKIMCTKSANIPDYP